ncbi:succinylglutamate desuccinylase/aspartoacylase family protein [Haladaptatus pallidirubidus]|uniref:Succinylglutamate desuccinylase/Aspartoacylase catalytic domain-containing protein n=1 Tax=Haladaptatus pallidirubidus TaxID=1008152 RepID=A0AAV3UND4_9EURY|nr:succinylglutamate desuccinylase/aspartoacylase family protein [Haladaptatus pallidirubidus]
MLKSGGALMATAAGFTGLGAASGERSSYTIRTGTEEETEVYVTKSGEPGPTAVVVGGIHGNEESGYRAVDDVATWSIDRGELVMIPRANPIAIKRGTYSNDNGNLNRKFTPGKEPKTALARAIWSAIDRHNPKTVLSLHSSKGLYREAEGPDGDGQAIYPTLSEGADEDATMTARYMNQYHLDDSLPEYYEFKRGNLIDGDSPLLIHKVGADMYIPGYIVETTRYGTSLNTRVNWTLNIVRHLLRRNGMDRTYE